MFTENRSTKPFYKALKELIDLRDISYRDLGKECGLSATHLNRVVNQKANTPPPETIAKIAAGLRVSPMYFLEYRQAFVAKKAKENILFLNRAVNILEKAEREKKSSG